MEKLLSEKEFSRMSNELDKVKYKCSYCGRRAIIPKCIDKVVCDWCGHYVFKNKKDEDIYRIREKMKK